MNTASERELADVIYEYGEERHSRRIARSIVAARAERPLESTGQLAAKFPGAQLGPALDSVPFPLPGGGTGNDLYIKREEFRRVFAADVPQEVADLMAATQRPIAAAALEEPATRTAWTLWPVLVTKRSSPVEFRS